MKYNNCALQITTCFFLILGLSACDIGGIRFTNPMIDTSALPTQSYKPGDPHYPPGNIPYLMAKKETTKQHRSDLVQPVSYAPPKEEEVVEAKPLPPEPWWKRIFSSNSNRSATVVAGAKPAPTVTHAPVQLAEKSDIAEATEPNNTEALPAEDNQNAVAQENTPWWKRMFKKSSPPPLNSVPEAYELADPEADKKMLREGSESLKEDAREPSHAETNMIVAKDMHTHTHPDWEAESPLPDVPVDHTHHADTSESGDSSTTQTSETPKLENAAIHADDCHYAPPKLLPQSRYTKKRRLSGATERHRHMR